MAGYNKVFLAGRLTASPELRYTKHGRAVGEFRLAVNRKYRSRTGETKESVCFVDVDVFGDEAEACHRSARKGTALFVEGRLFNVSWRDKHTGEHRSRLKVICERFQIVSGEGNTHGPSPS